MYLVRHPAALAALALVLLASCRRGPGVDEQVAIGLASPMQPAGTVQRPALLSVRQGSELAISHLNDARPRGTPAFVLRTVSPELTSPVEIATTLRDDATVVGVVGHTDSGASLETAAIYEDAERQGQRAVVAVSPTSTSERLSGRSRWFFRVCPNDLAASREAARFALDSLRAKRASIIYRNDVYGRGWTRAFSEAYVAGGGKVLHRGPHLPNMMDWEAYAGLVRAQQPELVLFPGSPADAATFIRAVRRAGGTPAVLGGDAVSELQGQSAEFAGVYYTAFFLPTRPPNAEGRAFVQAFERRFRNLPDQRAALAYDATMLIGRAVLAVGPDRAKIQQYLETVGRSTPAMNGVTGTIAFDDKHDVVNKQIAIARVGGR